MSTQPNPGPNNIESWEQKEAQIRAERAEEFSRLSPEEQQNILDAEKKSFHLARHKLREDLGFGRFKKTDHKENDPAKSSSPKLEETEREAAVREMEEKLDTPPDTDQTAEKPEKLEKQPDLNLQKFLLLFDAACENISRQKPFEYRSVALDDFAHPITQKAYMRRLFDHSQQQALPVDRVRERLVRGQSRPEQISLDLEVDMGEDGNNSLGLTNLHLRLSLASLIEGQLIEKLSRFTNLVYFAAQMHDRQQKLAFAAKRVQDDRSARPETPIIDRNKERFQIKEISKNGGLQKSDGLFRQGETGTVAFAFNSGSVWGTFEGHGAPASPLELQEALDKINIEQ